MTQWQLVPSVIVSAGILGIGMSISLYGGHPAMLVSAPTPAAATGEATAQEDSPQLATTTVLKIIVAEAGENPNSDAPNAPIQGAKVRVQWVTEQGDIEQSGTTDSQGIKIFDKVARGAVTILVIATRYEPFAKTVNLTDPTLTFPVYLKPETH